MFGALQLLRSDRADAGSAIGFLIERLEQRCLLSVAALVTIPLQEVGVPFNGTLHLHEHVTAGAKAHSVSVPLTLQFSQISASDVEGTQTLASGDEVFTGTASGRSFSGVFSDGETIRGTFSDHGLIIDGKVKETVNGQLITGHYHVKDPPAHPLATAKKKQGSSQLTPTPINFIAGAGTTVNAISSAAPNSGGSVAPTTPVALPSLETSFLSSDTLNDNTTVNGVAAQNATVTSEISGQASIPGLPAQNGGLNASFSTSSGIISISSPAPAFTPSSGLTPITTQFSPSSGIVSVVGASPTISASSSFMTIGSGI